MSTSPAPTLHLHTFYRSSCACRVRTAAHLKSLPLTYAYVSLPAGEQFAPQYTATNPSASVPTLTVTPADGSPPIIIRQSVAILEFLEEYFPDTTPLLPPPSDPVARAKVRELVNIIANDTQPPTNLRILNRVAKLGGDRKEWARELMEDGLRAFDTLAKKYAGKYSVGDQVTMADVVLAPAVEGGLRWGVDVKKLETVWRVYEEIRGLDAFQKGGWRSQGDTPGEFRL